MPVPFLICDVFAEERFEGNQLAVLPDADGVPEERMQAIAREFNFSETVLCFPAQGDGDALPVRIFTPVAELPFAGHPLIGTAALVAAGRSSVPLTTSGGRFVMEVRAVNDGRWDVTMPQPVPSVSAWPEPGALMAALGAPTSLLPVELYDLGIRHIYVQLAGPDEVAALTPDLVALEKAAGARGVICFAGQGRQWKARMFGPGLGVPEDPATGSAAGPLAVHLCRHGLLTWGEEILIEQGAEVGRPSQLRARASGQADTAESVAVAGTVIACARGELEL